MDKQTFLFDTLRAMQSQEVAYAKRDFLSEFQTTSSSSSNSGGNGNGRMMDLDIDRDCRDKMCEWTYQIIDFCKFDRESVEIAMNYLDRFLLTRSESATRALHDRSVYQLASMSALYTAVKIHEPQALNPTVVSQLSRNTYSTQQIEEMEASMLQALDWRVNPPTALAFVREFIRIMMIPPNGGSGETDPTSELAASTQATILALAAMQTEHAVGDYSLISTPASSIAYCAFLNAMEATVLASSSSSMDGVVHTVGHMLACQVLGWDAAQIQGMAALRQTLRPVCLAAAVARHLLPVQRGIPASAPPKPQSCDVVTDSTVLTTTTATATAATTTTTAIFGAISPRAVSSTC